MDTDRLLYLKNVFSSVKFDELGPSAESGRQGTPRGTPRGTTKSPRGTASTPRGTAKSPRGTASPGHGDRSRSQLQLHFV